MPKSNAFNISVIIISMVLVLASCNKKQSREVELATTHSTDSLTTQKATTLKPALIYPTNKPNKQPEVTQPEAATNKVEELTETGQCALEQAIEAQGLVNIQEICPNVLVQLAYTTTHNFVKKDVYGCLDQAFLQKRTANMLLNASVALQKINPDLRLVVYDAGRPLQAQYKLWEALPQYEPNERKKYVASPSETSIHNYGCAVDLSIAYTNGKAIDMGTPYDYFGELAYPKAEKKLLATGKLSAEQVANRLLLRKVMRQAGFMPIDYEWWHFNSVSRKQAKKLYAIIQ
jgi:zinc D-Ala-D-Ala dipeptidase